MPAVIAKGKEIMKIRDDARLIGFPSARGPNNAFELIMKVFQVSAKGLPKNMLWFDSQMLIIKWRIIQLMLRAIAKTLEKSCIV